jgi:hypothetical protein
MGRLSNMKRKTLSLEDLEKYPIWTWDDEMENLEPITELEPNSRDYHDLFIKSTFKTDNHVFEGYIMGGKNPYGFAILISKKEILFNKNLPEFVSQAINEIYLLMHCNRFDFFPVYYESEVHLKDKKLISGVFYKEDFSY